MSAIKWLPHPDPRFHDVTHGRIAGVIKYMIQEKEEGFELSFTLPNGRWRIKSSDHPFKTLQAAKLAAEEMEIKTTNA
jgi:hypothetical protein